MNNIKQNNGHSGQYHVDQETWLRLKLITAFNGDVPKAAVALEFVKGNPEASEEFRRFEAWQMENYREYCRRKGIILRGAPSEAEP